MTKNEQNNLAIGGAALAIYLLFFGKKPLTVSVGDGPVSETKPSVIPSGTGGGSTPSVSTPSVTTPVVATPSVSKPLPEMSTPVVSSPPVFETSPAVGTTLKTTADPFLGTSIPVIHTPDMAMGPTLVAGGSSVFLNSRF